MSSPYVAGEDATPRPGSFLFNVNLVFAGTIVDYALALLVSVLLARGLGPEGRGIVAIYQSAVNLGFAFLSLGITAATVFYVARREVSPRQATEAGLSVTLLAACLAALGVVALALAQGGSFSRDGAPFWLAAVTLPALVQFSVLDGVLRAAGRFGAMKLLEASLPLSTLAALAAVELIWGLRVRGAVYAWSLSFLPPLLLGYVLAGRAAWPRALGGIDLTRRLAALGAQSQLSNLIQLLNYRLDAYLVLLFAGAGGVGIYSVGVSLSEGMWLVANSAAVVLLTDITAGDAGHAARTTPLVCRNTLLVTALGSLAAVVVAPFAVPLLFGRAYDESVIAFVLLLPGTVALAGAKVLSAYVFSRGRPLINAAIALATLAVTIVADLALIPLAGVPGAAAGASLAYCASLALTALAYRRLSGNSLRAALLPQGADARLYSDAARSLLARLPGRPTRARLDA